MFDTYIRNLEKRCDDLQEKLAITEKELAAHKPLWYDNGNGKWFYKTDYVVLASVSRVEQDEKTMYGVSIDQSVSFHDSGIYNTLEYAMQAALNTLEKKKLASR